MIVVKVELWPKGDANRAKTLGVASICNVGGDLALADYECRLFKWRDKTVEKLVLKPLAKDTWKRGRVEGFGRITQGPWDLLYRTLAVLIGTRNMDVKDAPKDAKFGRAP
jgi:hypothetical protein